MLVEKHVAKEVIFGMPQNDDENLAWLKFHWEKWKEEANRFWRHLALATLALMVMNLYQLDIVQIDFASIKVVANVNTNSVKRWLICPVSIWLWLSLVFTLVDFLRHRVPEKYEGLIHNNEYLVPGLNWRLDLKRLTRILYLLVILSYITILYAWMFYCSLKVWQ